MEIARKAGKTLIELHVTTNEDRFDSAVALQQFLAMLTRQKYKFFNILIIEFIKDIYGITIYIYHLKR